MKYSYIRATVKHNLFFCISICHRRGILYNRDMQTEIFYPKTRFFPTQPQILHQLTLEFFLMADRFKEKVSEWALDRAIIAPYGSYFDVGQALAALYRYWGKEATIKRVVVISFAELDEDISFLTADYKSLHTFLGEISLDRSPLQKLSIHTDNKLFAQHADPIVCQLPFLRGYRQIDAVTPIIVNTKKTDLNRKWFWSALATETDDVGYVLCSNTKQEMLPEGCAKNFIDIISPKLFCFY